MLKFVIWKKINKIMTSAKFGVFFNQTFQGLNNLTKIGGPISASYAIQYFDSSCFVVHVMYLFSYTCSVFLGDWFGLYVKKKTTEVVPWRDFVLVVTMENIRKARLTILFNYVYDYLTDVFWGCHFFCENNNFRVF